MNKNRKIKRTLTTSLAVGMSVMMGAVPVYAAGSSSIDKAVYKDETVYVNADATGKTDSITVSNWLKNSGSVSGSLTDASELKDIKNIKGDETFTTSGDKLTWKTEGNDIYYQGTTNKELPVTVKLTYYLDGKEIKPDDLKGKSGHLKIKVDYTNTEKKTVEVDGKKQEVYTPFVMMTGMIMPNETFSNVTIDNGKVISDGSKNIVVGFGMPGLKDSLNLDDAEDKDLTIPESLEVEADVTDFTMSSTFTVALTDLLDDMNIDDIADFDELQDSLDELEDAALELVSGSNTLADGAGTLADGVDSYTEGADTLNEAIQTYLGTNGQLSGSVTEYVNGVNKVVKGVQDYTDGANTLADGVTSYIDGEKQLAAGAAKLSALSSGLQQVQDAVAQLEAATDGEGSTTEDLQAASQALAAGTAQMKAALGSDEVQALLGQVNDMVQTGNTLLSETKTLGSMLQNDIAAPITTIATTLQEMQGALAGINEIQSNIQAACESINTLVAQDNSVIEQARNTAASSSETISSSIGALEAKRNEASNNGDEETANALQSSIDALYAAKDATDGVSNNLQTLTGVDPSQLPSIDTEAIQQNIDVITSEAGKLQTALPQLQAAIPELEKQLQSIEAAEGVLAQADQLKTLTGSVDQLNAGMQGLNSAIGTLHSNLAALNSATSTQFPVAMQGISDLNQGFAQLGSYNDALLDGASTLKDGSSTLVAGVKTLQGGTNQLASGLNTLGSQLSSGAAKLASNSKALRDGASTLQSGAKELAEGMDKFDKEGTSKLKSTVEDELGDVLDRLDAITSEDCVYDSYSGKDGSMDGNVKFVIETDAIE